MIATTFIENSEESIKNAAAGQKTRSCTAAKIPDPASA
jgi:hypothetical protein